MVSALPVLSFSGVLMRRDVSRASGVDADFALVREECSEQRRKLFALADFAVCRLRLTQIRAEGMRGAFCQRDGHCLADRVANRGGKRGIFALLRRAD